MKEANPILEMSYSFALDVTVDAADSSAKS